METWNIKFKGKPIPKQRPRHCKSGYLYDPQNYLKTDIRVQLKDQFQQDPIEGRVFLSAYFFFEPPKSLSKKKREQLIESPHIIRPDTTNLVKFYEDCMNGIVFKDDSQIMLKDCAKFYHYEPRTLIQLWWND